MIIIDEQNDVADYLKQINFDQQGCVRLDLNTFELSQSVIDEITIIHLGCLKKLSPSSLAKLEEISAVMIFSPEEEKNVNVEKWMTANTLDIINLSTAKKLFENKTMLLSSLIKEKQVLRSQLLTISGELTETMGSVESELLKIKKVYERKIPRRFNNIKGIQIFSKYTAGENIGGEFFDLYVDQSLAFVVMSSTSSYLASSMILKLFADFKKDQDINHRNMLNFIDDVRSNTVELNQSKKKEIEIHLFVGIVDLNKHSIDGYSFGDFKIMSTAKILTKVNSVNLVSGDIENAAFHREFEREERVLLCSPGFVKNWKALQPEFMVEELIIDKSIKPIDILDETFFQLKKNSKNNFLAFDASAILMEVEKNAMVQV